MTGPKTLRKKDKTKNTSGFRKGFLLSSENRSDSSSIDRSHGDAPTRPRRAEPFETVKDGTRRPVVTSPMLLEVEEGKQSKPLLMVVDEEDAQREQQIREPTSNSKASTVRPLIGFLDDDDNEDFGMSEVSPAGENAEPSDKPLVEVVSYSDREAPEVLEEAPLADQATSPLISVRAGDEGHLGTDLDGEAFSESNREGDMLSSGRIRDATSLDTNTSQFQLLNSQLAGVLSQIRRTRGSRAKWRPMAIEFAEDKRRLMAGVTGRRFVWEFLLDNMSNSSRRSTPEKCVGTVLLESSGFIDEFECFLDERRIEDREARVRTLAAVNMIAFWVSQLDCIASNPGILDSIERLLPRLLAVASFKSESAPARRTVLAQSSLDAYVTIVALLVDEACDSPPELRGRLETLLWSIAGDVDKLMVLQLEWIDSGRPEAERDDEVSPQSVSVENRIRDFARKQVFLDWRRFFSQCQGTEARIGTGMARRAWCRGLRGAALSSADDRTVFVAGVRDITIAKPELSNPARMREQLSQMATNMGTEGPEDQRARLRFCMAWFGRGNKHIGRVNNNFVSAALQNCTTLLGSRLPYDSSVLLVAIIETLWCFASGRVGKVASLQDEPLVGAFESLVQVLSSMGDRSSASGLAVNLVSRCIRMQRDGLLLSNFSLMCNQCDTFTVDTLLCVIRQEDDGILGSRLYPTARQIRVSALVSLFQHALSSQHLMERLRSQSQLLQCEPPSFIIPELTRLLVEREENGMNGTAAAIALDDVLANYLGSLEHDPVTASAVVDAFLMSIAKTETSQSSPTEKNLEAIAKVSAVFGSTWRTSLLTEGSPTVFSVVLTAIAGHMFDRPSELLPLTLFGFVVGDGADAHTFPEAISRAVHCLLQLSLSRIAKGCDNAESSTFSRLSPLLMLRRIPRQFFGVARQHTLLDSLDAMQMKSNLTSLASLLAQRLDIESSTDNVGRFSSQERRLAAEIAGRALPLGKGAMKLSSRELPPEASCFQSLCVPAFSALLQDLRDNNQSVSVLTSHIRSARAALYAVCLAIPFVGKEDDGEPVLWVSSFALDVLQDEGQSAEGVKLELEQLETGCIEFLACCLQRHFAFGDDVFQVQNNPSEYSSGGTFPCKAAAATKQLYSIVLAVCCDGRIGVDALPLWDNSRYTEGHSGHRYSIETRTRSWNACLLASQRCEEQNGALKRFGHAILPRILEWRRTWPKSLHPLCVAAAFKIILTIGTRARSLDQSGIAENDVEEVHQWTVKTIAGDHLKYGPSVSHEVRMAALKLLLLLVSLDSMETSPGYERRIALTLTSLQRIANENGDVELQKLARDSVKLLLR